MTASAKRARVFFLGNPNKPDAAAALEQLSRHAQNCCDVVGAELTFNGRLAIEAGATCIVVLGGDGTLIAVARSLGHRQMPLVGVNVGKLGYLAEFTGAELIADFGRIVSDPGLIHKRLMLQAEVRRDGGSACSYVAVNDCVIHAGPPYRMVGLSISINNDPLTQVTGDGLIISTAVGSTAHNLSAGGPIMLPDVRAVILTPLCPHSLTHKAIVIEPESVVDIRADQVNIGTTVIMDGQEVFPLVARDVVCIQRSAHDLLLVRNPAQPHWHKLVTKLHWGRPPGQL